MLELYFRYAFHLFYAVIFILWLILLFVCWVVRLGTARKARLHSRYAPLAVMQAYFTRYNYWRVLPLPMIGASLAFMLVALLQSLLYRTMYWHLTWPLYFSVLLFAVLWCLATFLPAHVFVTDKALVIVGGALIQGGMHNDTYFAEIGGLTIPFERLRGTRQQGNLLLVDYSLTAFERVRYKRHRVTLRVPYNPALETLLNEHVTPAIPKQAASVVL